MATHAPVTQGLLKIILASLSVYAVQSHGSPLSDTSSSSCPRGWYQYDRFCVTRGQGTSERAVALYCDGFGGIGIKGLCIIRVPTDRGSNSQETGRSESGRSSSELKTLDSASRTDSNYVASSDTERLLSLYRDAVSRDTSSSDFFGADIPGTDIGAEDGFCPRGWSHFRSMCVYKPSSLVETCRLLDSVEFHGLCVKHAGSQTLANIDLEEANSREKRICCCASFKAKGNNYGC